MITVNIEGTNRTRLVDYFSLVINNVKTNHPDTCSFIIKKFGDRSYSPTVNEEVIITDADSVRIFAGHIINVDEVYDKADIIGYKIKCTDYTRMMDNKLIVDVYEDKTVSEIIQLIKDNYLDNSITITNVNVDTLIDYIAFNYEYPSDALRQLAEMSDSDWYIDYNKDIHFFHRETDLAPFDLTDANGKYIYDSLTIRRKLSQLKNIVYVRGGEFLGNTITAAFEADGVRANFYLPSKFSNLTLTVTGQEKSVGVDPIDDPTNYDALHNFQERVVKFREDRKPDSGSEVRIGGSPNIPVLVKMRDTDSIETFTVREYVVIDKSIKSKEGARQRALAELLTYRTTISEGKFRTYQSGLKAGQKINVQSDLRGLDEDFIVNRVQARIFGTDASDKSVKLEYSVELVTIKTFNYIQLLKKLLNERKKDIIISDDEVLDEVEQISEEVTIQDTVTASISHNPQTEEIEIEDAEDDKPLDYPVKFVLGGWTPLDWDILIATATNRWKLEEGSGSKIVDSIGAVTGTSTGINWIAKGLNGYCMDFDTNSSDKIDLDSIITLSGAFTITFFANYDGGDSGFLSICGNQTNFNNGRFAYNPGASLIAMVTASGGIDIDMLKNLTADTWQLLTITRDGSDDMKVYIDGEDVTDGSPNRSGNILVNRIGLKPDNSGYHSWDGYMADFRIYNGVTLNQSQVQQLADRLKRVFVISGSRLS